MFFLTELMHMNFVHFSFPLIHILFHPKDKMQFSTSKKDISEALIEMSGWLIQYRYIKIYKWHSQTEHVQEFGTF